MESLAGAGGGALLTPGEFPSAPALLLRLGHRSLKQSSTGEARIQLPQYFVLIYVVTNKQANLGILKFICGQLKHPSNRSTHNYKISGILLLVVLF